MEISKNVFWTGKIDWELRKFHGDELSTDHGSSYNSYLIKDEKNVLIDTVWTPFTGEFIQNLKKNIDLTTIDYVVVCHAEPDHAGALGHLMALLPENTPIYCTANGQKSISGYHHKEWNFQTVKTGDSLNLGKRILTFIEAPMLHWPDTMMCHLSENNILFSNDIFGQHLASEFMFNDKVSPEELQFESIKYFTNIISPFKKKVLSALEQLESMNLPISMICPAHGVIWHDKHQEIIENYKTWAGDYSENQITIAYETMYNSTRKLAEALARGIRQQDSTVTVKLFNIANTDNSDLLTEIFRSKAVLVGCPTYNSGILGETAALLDELANMKLTGKKAAAFGSYGWSPANIKVLNTRLEDAGFQLIGKGNKCPWNPDEAALQAAEQYGSEIAASF